MPDDSWNPDGADIPLRRLVRDLRPERVRDRHGHDRHVAVRAAARGSGGDPVPVALPRHGGEARRPAVPPRHAERPGPLGRCADRPEDAAEPAARTTASSCPSSRTSPSLMPGTSATALATDHARDLDRLSAEIAELERAAGPRDAETATRLASCRVNRASLSGDLSEMRRAAAALDAALERFGPWPDLCFLRAGVHLKQHRLDDAVGEPCAGRGARRLRRRPGDPGRRRPPARPVRGRRAAPTSDSSPRPDSWDALARLAHFEQMLGDPDAGRRALRRGRRRDHRQGAPLLRVGRGAPGPPAPASRPARRGGAALRARGGCVLGLLARRASTLAELRAAQGRIDEAIALYEDVAARAARPELAQAAGDLHRRAGDPDAARAWHERALAGYLESAGRGEVQYHHHLAEYYADVEATAPPRCTGPSGITPSGRTTPPRRRWRGRSTAPAGTTRRSRSRAGRSRVGCPRPARSRERSTRSERLERRTPVR